MSPRGKTGRKKPEDPKREEGKDRPGRRVRPRGEAGPPKEELIIMKVHTLGENETWTHLSLKYYGHTTEPYWRLIYEANKEMVGDDYRRIWGGMEINIPELPDELKDK